MVFFIKNRKNYKICIYPQKISNSQNTPEKGEKKKKQEASPSFQIILQIFSNKKKKVK